MPMIRCDANEHYFDNSKHSKCPFCTSGRGSDEKTSMVNKGGEDKTEYIDNSAENKPSDIPTPKKEDKSMHQDDPKTIAPWQRKKAKTKSNETLEPASTDKSKTSFSNAPVVGWLVIVEGNHKGEDFRIIPGINTIGRDSANQICIDSGDHEISRERHCIIEFDVKNSKFYLERGATTTYLNDNRVGGDGSELALDDIIELGATKLRFVPFCSAEFCWDM